MADNTGSRPVKPTQPKSPRQHYNIIHANPIPVQVHPLPPLIPHNPLSVLHIAFVYLKQLFLPPTSFPLSPYTGYFSTQTCSVHVTDEVSVLALWRSGFFGKGNLSRSEPTWLGREKRRLGIVVEETAEEITAKRRAERKTFKQERARKAREEIDAQSKAAQAGNAQPAEHFQATEGTVDDQLPLLSAPAATNQENNGKSDSEVRPTPALQETVDANGTIGESQLSLEPQEAGELINQEHLQLELVEAFFLTYALGIFQVLSLDSDTPMSTTDLLKMCLAHASFPPQIGPLDDKAPAPDNRFLVSYVAYHHFRSLGWVARSGVKFGVDLLLYNRGPVFSHAEFAVCIVPAYSHTFWHGAAAASIYGNRKGKPWHWLHMLNRVQSQVRKTLVMCFVEIPPPFEAPFDDDFNIAALLRMYKVREVVVKRWVPNRSRD